MHVSVLPAILFLSAPAFNTLVHEMDEELIRRPGLLSKSRYADSAALERLTDG
jgi:hypothetical protein